MIIGMMTTLRLSSAATKNFRSIRARPSKRKPDRQQKSSTWIAGPRVEIAAVFGANRPNQRLEAQSRANGIKFLVEGIVFQLCRCAECVTKHDHGPFRSE